MQENAKISKNAPCPCGSGKKYKMCCGDIYSRSIKGCVLCERYD